MQRFYVEIRDADNKVHRVLSGYESREAAEQIAVRYRENISVKGWNMKVYVGEAHKIVGEE